VLPWKRCAAARSSTRLAWNSTSTQCKSASERKSSKNKPVWSTDITHIRLAKGFVYLVAVMDWYSRKCLSWRISNSMGGRGRAFDNIFVERPWRNVKYEDIYLKGYATV